jgi:hypothetical protein
MTPFTKLICMLPIRPIRSHIAFEHHEQFVPTSFKFNKSTHHVFTIVINKRHCEVCRETPTYNTNSWIYVKWTSLQCKVTPLLQSNGLMCSFDLLLFMMGMCNLRFQIKFQQAHSPKNLCIWLFNYHLSMKMMNEKVMIIDSNNDGQFFFHGWT